MSVEPLRLHAPARNPSIVTLILSKDKGQEIMKEFKGAPALDAGEHYEIARYGTLKTWATELGLNQAVKLLETTLAEEKKTDETLTRLAESEVNQQHAQAA
jgi:ferritin-like metal-binding protein YciE